MSWVIKAAKPAPALGPGESMQGGKRHVNMNQYWAALKGMDVSQLYHEALRRLDDLEENMGEDSLLGSERGRLQQIIGGIAEAELTDADRKKLMDVIMTVENIENYGEGPAFMVPMEGNK